MMIKAKDVQFIRNWTGQSIVWSKAAAELLLQEGYDIYSDEAKGIMMEISFVEKAYRYMKYLEIKSLFKEFGPITVKVSD